MVLIVAVPAAVVLIGIAENDLGELWEGALGALSCGIGESMIYAASRHGARRDGTGPVA